MFNIQKKNVFQPPGELHGDLLRAGEGPFKPVQVGQEPEGEGAPHHGSVRGRPVQAGRPIIQRHQPPDGRGKQGEVGLLRA